MLLFSPQYSNQNFRASIASKQRDNSYERMIFSKIGSSNTFETPYKSKEDQYNKNFAVVSSKLALNSSFDPRTHNEQGMKGMYDYYKFGSQNKPDPFERDFSVFIDNSNSMINEISTLNNSGSKFNNDQMVKTNTLHNKVRKYPENVNYETIREYNKNKVRFHQGFSELGPANTIKFKQSWFWRSTLLKFYCILEESALSRNEEAVALSLLEDREYVDINQTNKELL